MKNLMIEYKICVTVLVFFVLVTFVKNPEKNKDYNKCCLPFQPFFLFVCALCISLGGDIAFID